MKYSSIFSFFWHHIKPYKWFYALMMVAPLVTAFHTFVYNYCIKLFLDVMAQGAHITYQDFMTPLIIFLLIQVIVELVWRISNWAEWRSEPYVRRSILVESYDYVQHHSYIFFQNNFTGAVTSKIKSLLDGYDKFWATIHHGFVGRIFNSSVNIVALLFVNRQLGIAIVVWSAVYIWTRYRLALRLNQLSFEETESRHALIGQVSDRITNIISLFSFASRQRELRHFSRQISSDFIPRQIKVYKYDFKANLVAGTLYTILFTFLIFYTLHLRLAGLISIGDFAFIFGIVLVIAHDIWEISTSVQDFARQMGDCKSALSILNIPHDHQDRKDARPLTVKTPEIAIKNVGFAYKGTQPLFNNLNLTIHPGENIGLVGASGAGKSSLINLLLRYFERDRGKILIDGQDINDVTQDSLRENIAIIPQDTLLFHRTLMENIRYGNPDATDAQVMEASKKARLHDFVMSLPQKYNTYVGERGIKLSGGQRQRVAIARAMLKHAPILVLDEATSSLDSQTEKAIQEGLDFFLKDKKKTVIAIAHRLSTLKYMDRIIVLDKGKVIEEGTHDQLLRDKKSLYSTLWKLQKI